MFNLCYNKGMENTKICVKCGYELLLEEFYIISDGRIRSWCRTCMSKAAMKSAKKILKKRRKFKVCIECGKELLKYSNRFCKLHYIHSATRYVIGRRCQKFTLKLIEKFDKNNICPYTGETLILGLNTHLDHILPRSRYPDLATSIDNLEWVSAVANHAKGTMTKKEFLSKYKITYIG